MGGRMKEAVIFSGFSSLDFLEVRQSVVRIPEVAIRLRELQKLWDKFGPGPMDVFNMIASDDSSFFSSLTLKQFIVSVVQIGLYDRHFKRSGLPSHMIGIVSKDSAMAVCAQQKTFEDFTLEFIARLSHQAVSNQKNMSIVPSESNVTLTGSALDHFGIIDVIEGPSFIPRPSRMMTMSTIVQELVDADEVKRFVHIGPGRSFFEELHRNFALSDIEFIESIELDPMLNWFWPSIREASQHASGNMII